MNDYATFEVGGLGKAKVAKVVDPAMDVLARAGYGPTAKQVPPGSTATPEEQGFFSKLPSWALPVAIVGGVVLIGGLVWFIKRKRG
jgi:hypothetical protein